MSECIDFLCSSEALPVLNMLNGSYTDRLSKFEKFALFSQKLQLLTGNHIRERAMLLLENELGFSVTPDMLGDKHLSKLVWRSLYGDEDAKKEILISSRAICTSYVLPLKKTSKKAFDLTEYLSNEDFYNAADINDAVFILASFLKKEGVNRILFDTSMMSSCKTDPYHAELAYTEIKRGKAQADELSLVSLWTVYSLLKNSDFELILTVDKGVDAVRKFISTVELLKLKNPIILSFNIGYEQNALRNIIDLCIEKNISSEIFSEEIHQSHLVENIKFLFGVIPISRITLHDFGVSNEDKKALTKAVYTVLDEICYDETEKSCCLRYILG